MDNLAYDEAYAAENYEGKEPDYELIGGVKHYMAAAAPFLNHITIVNRISRAFSNYIEDNNIEAFVFTEADVYLSDKHHYRPDLIVLRDLSKISTRGERIYGAPELVVEVLSKATMNNDLGPKRAAYEEFGVKEYWIVDPWSKRIEVYHLVNGKFVLGAACAAEYDEDDNEGEEVPDVPIDKIQVSIFDDLTVDVKDVFKWYINTSVKEK